MKDKDDQKSMRKKLFGEGDILNDIYLFITLSDSGFPVLLFRLLGGSLVIIKIFLI
jgi:hypothetical protein